jgi:hypothetical protein
VPKQGPQPGFNSQLLQLPTSPVSSPLPLGRPNALCNLHLHLHRPIQVARRPSRYSDTRPWLGSFAAPRQCQLARVNIPSMHWCSMFHIPAFNAPPRAVNVHHASICRWLLLAIPRTGIQGLTLLFFSAFLLLCERRNSVTMLCLRKDRLSIRMDTPT